MKDEVTLERPCLRPIPARRAATGSAASRLTRAVLALSLGFALAGVARETSAVSFPVISTFESGFEDWTVYVGLQLSWSSSGGSPGAFLGTRDLDPYSGGSLLAPSKFLGNWSSLNGVGRICFDFRCIDPDGRPIISGPQVVIAGPGGLASVDDLPLPTGAWTSYSVPLNSGNWTLEWGSWAALLSNVTEIRVGMDVTTGQDVNGLDDFYVGAGAGCPNGVPDSAASSVTGLRLCPAGDLVTSVTVRDRCGLPVPDVSVRVSFTACDSVRLCPPPGGDPYSFSPGVREIYRSTDADGRVDFPIRGGGVASLPCAVVSASGVVLARLPVASVDQDGDRRVTSEDEALFLAKMYTMDPTADLDTDGDVDEADAAEFQLHYLAGHYCENVADPGLCVVGRVAVCPGRDLWTSVMLRNFFGEPADGRTVILDFDNCFGTGTCGPDGSERYAFEPGRFRISRVSGSDGRADFPVRGGGAWPVPAAIVSVDGLLLAEKPVASPDQDGDLDVDGDDEAIFQSKLGSGDPGADFDADGDVDGFDLDTLQVHLTCAHSCMSDTILPDCQSLVPRLAVCPAGDLPFDVTVRTILGAPVPGALVSVSFGACDSVQLSPPNGTEPYTIVPPGRSVSRVANGSGVVAFPIRAGGVCAEALAEVRANGTLVAQRAVASPDQDGSLFADAGDDSLAGLKLESASRTADLDADQVVTAADLALISDHTRCLHSRRSGAGVPDPCNSWVSCIVLCPEGDISTSPWVGLGDFFGVVVPNEKVVLSFAACDTVQLCRANGGEPFEFEPGRYVVSQVTSGGGLAVFPLRGGGVSSGARAEVWSDSVIIARRPVASVDQNGDLVVNGTDYNLILWRYGMGLSDPAADINCDGGVTVTDIASYLTHVGHNCESAVSVDPTVPPVTAFTLHPARPNPARGAAEIRFDLPVAGKVTLRVYDVAGRIVRTAFADAPLPAGRHRWEWDGRDDLGVRVKAGAYFCRAIAPGADRARGLVLIE